MNKLVYLFSVGHFTVDWCQGAIPALLPYFIAHYDLSYQAAASLVFANVMVASVLQPLFGYLSDRVSKPWFIPLGPLCCGASMLWMCMSSSYVSLFAAAMLCGLGSSIFHPEGALMVNRIAGGEKGRALGCFSVGGNVGFAAGPAAAGFLVYVLGIEWMACFTVINTVIAAAIFFVMPRAMAAAADFQKKEKQTGQAPVNRWGPFGVLSVGIMARSMGFTLANTFIPIFWITVLGASEKEGAGALSILFLTGACCTYLGGVLADRFDMRTIVRAAFLLMVPALYFLVNSRDVWTATALLVPAAVSIFLQYSPMVVLGQTYLAKNAGFASGVTLGLSTTFGGLMAPLVGWAADQWGVAAALQVLWMAGLAGLLASLFLPKEEG